MGGHATVHELPWCAPAADATLTLIAGFSLSGRSVQTIQAIEKYYLYPTRQSPGAKAEACWSEPCLPRGIELATLERTDHHVFASPARDRLV